MVLDILLCVSLISGKAEHLSVCFFPNSFFFLNACCLFKCFVYLFIGGRRFQCVFLSIYMIKEKGVQAS